MFRGRIFPMAWILAGLWLAGCEEVKVQRYRLARIEQPTSAAKVPYRTLGAILPQGERSWFFKLMGPADRVAAQKAAFDSFVRSIRLTPDGPKPIVWKVPEGWRQEPGSPARYATLQIDAGDPPLELSVTFLGGDLRANVNRWREQLSLPPIESQDLDKTTERVTLDGGAVLTLVDLNGEAVPGRPRRGP